jgi:CelD/BcsL family acetyltransferase involved in cellulose biosynthesis
VRVLDARYLPGAIVDAWSDLQLSEPTLASPFFRPEFTRIVAAARNDVHVAVLEEDGFFPFQRSRFGVGRPVGSRLSDYHGLVASPESKVDAAKLLEECSLSTWEFDGLVAEQRSFRQFHRATRDSPIIDLAGGYEAYTTSRQEAGSSVLREAARKAKSLSRDLGRIRFEPHTSDPDILELLLAWKSAQYTRTGAVDIFGHAWVLDVIRHAHSSNTPHFAGLLSVLFAGDEPVAIHFGLRSASVWHWWLPAYDPARARYSPGILLLVAMARSAVELGVRAIDLGKGEALYKRRFANSSAAVAVGAVERPSVAAVWGRMERAANAILCRTPARGAVLRAATRRRLR